MRIITFVTQNQLKVILFIYLVLNTIDLLLRIIHLVEVFLKLRIFCLFGIFGFTQLKKSAAGN